MAFNKVDAYTYEDNGTVNVYDGMNIQLYASGNVYTSFPYIEYKQQGSSVPVLATAVLNDNNSNNIFSLTNMENDGFVDGDGNFHYVLFSEESPLTYNSFVTDAVYNWEVQAVDAFGGGSAGPLTAMSGSDWTYVLEGGPDKFWIKDLGNNQYAIDYARNPNWTPSGENPTVETMELGTSNRGAELLNLTNAGLGATESGNYLIYSSGSEDLGATLDTSTTYYFYYQDSDGSSAGLVGTLTAVSGSPNYLELAGNGNSPISEVRIINEGGTVYNTLLYVDTTWTPSNQHLINNLIKISG